MLYRHSVVANQAYLGAQVRTSNHRWMNSPCLLELQRELSLPDAIIRLLYRAAFTPWRTSYYFAWRIISPNTQLGPRVIVERNLLPELIHSDKNLSVQEIKMINGRY